MFRILLTEKIPVQHAGVNSKTASTLCMWRVHCFALFMVCCMIVCGGTDISSITYF